jgi:hypothetical protein
MKPPRRVYASWLPPNPRERAALVQLRRRQTTVILWLAGLIPAGWTSALVTGSDTLFVPITIFWIAVGVWLAHGVTAIPCPRCGQKFCSVRELPYWPGLFNRRCDACGLTLDRDEHTA